jgi:NAD(P)-dependent dehydrogenase (short-subunit alcohol dehydrogenase family)
VAAPDLTERPLGELVSLAGRVAVVTGGARGIGLATGRRLAEAGATVILADRDGDSARAAALSVPGASGHELEVTSSEAVSRLVARVVDELGRLDVWVSNAGIYPAHPVLEMADDDWDRVLDVDLRGVFLCGREAGRRMARLGNGGVIVNVASTASYRVAGVGVAHYVAAKHAVVGLTKSLAVELGPKGIRVLAVAPAVTLTPGIEERRPELERGGFVLEGLGAELPLGRIGVPDDVARVILFCACDLAAFMTGSTVAVDAGYLAT